LKKLLEYEGEIEASCQEHDVHQTSNSLLNKQKLNS